MISKMLLCWVLVAIVVFWCVGVYARLRRLRERYIVAMELALQQTHAYAGLVHAHLGEAHNISGQPPSAAWMPLVEALEVQKITLRTLAELTPAKTAGLSYRAAREAVDSAWQKLLAVPAERLQPMITESLRLQWDVLNLHVNTGCEQSNHVAVELNEAIGQFPTRLIAGSLRFEPVELL